MSRCSSLLALAAALGLVALAASPTEAQRRRDDFPSWEREVDPSIPDPLPRAPRGSFVAAGAFDLPAASLGVAALGDGRLAVAHVDGSVSFVDPDDGVIETIAVASSLDWPPASLGNDLLVAGRASVARVDATRVAQVDAGGVAQADASGVAWERQPPFALAATPRPIGGPPARAVVLVGEGGEVALLDAVSGESSWVSSLGAPVGAGPVTLDSNGRALLAFGTRSGDLVALDAATGEEAWRHAMGEDVTALLRDGDVLYGSAYGLTPRTPKQPGPHAFRLPLRQGVPRGAQWKLRLGGGARSMPLLLGPHVVFAASGGFVHALDREAGSEGWRFDLPAPVEHAPIHVAGRLEYVLALTPWAVAISAENGGLMGWLALPDEDELFVGPAVSQRGVTWVVTSLDRLLGVRFVIDDWPEPPEEKRRRP